MIVCGHGSVSEYCKENGLTLAARFVGDLIDYSGDIKTIVTDQEMGVQEFLYLRMVMLSKGYDLRSIYHTNIDEKMNEFLEYVGVQEMNRRKEKYGGRQPFGYRKVGDEVREIPEMIAVARKIIEMKDAGATLRKIHESEEIHHPDGRRISVSTIQQIIKNRRRYEGG